MSPQIDTLELSVNANTVTQAIAWLETISNRESWSSELRFSLTISIDEALTNIVSYAFENTPFMGGDDRMKTPAMPYKIFISCFCFPTKIQIKIIDNGKPYDPTKSIAPPLAESIDNAKIGGIGLRLMHHYLSDIFYYFENHQNHLILNKETLNNTHC